MSSSFYEFSVYLDSRTFPPSWTFDAAGKARANYDFQRVKSDLVIALNQWSVLTDEEKKQESAKASRRVAGKNLEAFKIMRQAWNATYEARQKAGLINTPSAPVGRLVADDKPSRGLKDFAAHIFDVARERLPETEFHEWILEADRRMSSNRPSMTLGVPTSGDVDVMLRKRVGALERRLADTQAELKQVSLSRDEALAVAWKGRLVVEEPIIASPRDIEERVSESRARILLRKSARRALP